LGGGGEVVRRLENFLGLTGTLFVPKRMRAV